MSGHMGNVRQTTQNLKVQKIDLENNFILIKGAVPGPNGSEVTIKPATKKHEITFLKSSKTTEAEVSEKIFGVEINKDLIAQLIKIYIENSHPGTKAQKNRSAVRGGGKKPWRQKGTGRARAGTSRSPLWRGGGVVFPASTKSAKPKKLNKKMYKSAMRSIFSSLAKENRVFCLTK